MLECDSQRSALVVVRSFVREWRGDARERETRDERRAIAIAGETLERGEIVVGL
jgi:hypothetical protein